MLVSPSELLATTICRHCAMPLEHPVIPELGLVCDGCYGALEEDAEWNVAAALDHARAGPSLRLASREAAAQLRRDLLALVIGVYPPVAVSILETFDFGSSFDRRGYSAQQLGQRDDAWCLCCEAAGVGDDRILDQLRAEVADLLRGWRGEVVDWFVEQVGAVALAVPEPIPPPFPRAVEAEWQARRIRLELHRRHLAFAMRPFMGPWRPDVPQAEIDEALRVIGEEWTRDAYDRAMIRWLEVVEGRCRDSHGRSDPRFWRALEGLLARRPDLASVVLVRWPDAAGRGSRR